MCNATCSAFSPIPMKKVASMKTANVRKINEAVLQQAMRGTCHVRTNAGTRVVRAKTVKGQLRVKLLDADGTWVNVETVNID